MRHKGAAVLTKPVTTPDRVIPANTKVFIFGEREDAFLVSTNAAGRWEGVFMAPRSAVHRYEVIRQGGV